MTYQPDKTNTPHRIILAMDRLGLRDVVMVGKHHYTQVHDCRPIHTHHRQMEICYCHQGEQVYVVNEEQYQIRGGNVFITFPDEKHGTGHFPEEKGELFWMLLTIPEEDSPRQFLHFSGQEARELVSALRDIRYRSFKGSKTMKALLNKILSIGAQGTDSLLTVKLYQLITEFLLEVLRYSETTSEADPVPKLHELDQFIAYHLHQPISLRQLATVAGMSLSHFKSWFREETGYTPLDYILRAKIRRAKQGLSDLNKPITALAYELGFSSSQYFATVFRKYTGTSPSGYRKWMVISS